MYKCCICACTYRYVNLGFVSNEQRKKELGADEVRTRSVELKVKKESCSFAVEVFFSKLGVSEKEEMIVLGHQLSFSWIND